VAALVALGTAEKQPLLMAFQRERRESETKKARNHQNLFTVQQPTRKKISSLIPGKELVAPWSVTRSPSSHFKMFAPTVCVCLWFLRTHSERIFAAVLSEVISGGITRNSTATGVITR
jgi:hypothetical protein